MRFLSRTFVIVSAIIATVAGFAFITLRSGGPEAVIPASNDNAASSSVSRSVAVHQAPAVKQSAGAFARARSTPVPAELPQSLQGTEQPDGWVQLDSDRNLVPTPELKALFEYYLAALGEESLSQVLARINRALSELPEPARTQAGKTLAGYLDYRLAVGELEASAGAAALDDDQRIDRMRTAQALRRQYLDADTADAFFGFEEAIDDFAMARLTINGNPALSDAEKQERIARAETRLPESIRQSRERSRAFQDYQARQAELAADPEALRQYRVRQFGPEAADRLARADQRRAEWHERWQRYRRAADAVAQSGLAAQEQSAEIERLRAQFFDGPELARARALDSLASPPVSGSDQ